MYHPTREQQQHVVLRFERDECVGEIPPAGFDARVVESQLSGPENRDRERICRQPNQTQKVKVLAACYDLDSIQVEFLT